jgi:hypothetical protein
VRSREDRNQHSLFEWDIRAIAFPASALVSQFGLNKLCCHPFLMRILNSGLSKTSSNPNSDQFCFERDDAAHLTQLQTRPG